MTAEPVTARRPTQNTSARTAVDRYKQYAEAVKKLLPLAQGDTGGSPVAARVLLSAYNGHLFKFGVSELCHLDATHFEAAMNVIAGRVELRLEPHELFTNGSEIFQALAKEYSPS